MIQYKAQRVRNMFDPKSIKPFKISRSKIEDFIKCPCCFYRDRRQGINKPPMFPYTLNNAVDTLLKSEFDSYRLKGESHPLIKEYNISAKPIQHEKLGVWRENFKGIQYHHKQTNFIITGAIDDLWQNEFDEYIIVDYKATSKKGSIEALDKDWHDGYKRQIEVYQWLLRKNGLRVSDTAYFLYCNGISSKEKFENNLEFESTLIRYKGDDSWIEDTITSMHSCLMSDTPPRPSRDCSYCAYIDAIK